MYTTSDYIVLISFILFVAGIVASSKNKKMSGFLSITCLLVLLFGVIYIFITPALMR